MSTGHRYKTGASFDQVLMLYRFEKKTRVLIFNEIENAVRSAIVETNTSFRSTQASTAT